MATTIVTKNGSGAPTDSDLVAGELAVDLTNGRLYTTDLDSGGTVLELGTNPASDVTFGDNTKAIFGAGSDLQIYHDGSNSYLEDTGTGVLFIKGTGGVYLRGKTTDEDLGRFLENGAVDLYYDGSSKLATTATGIDVTGTVTADGLTVESGGSISTSGGTTVSYRLDANRGTDDTNQGVRFGFAGIDAYRTSVALASSQTAINFTQTGSDGTRTLGVFTSDGDFQLNNLSSAAKFFWDASAESLGIGTSSPVRNLHISSASAEIMLEDSDGGSDDKRVTLKMNNGIFSLNSRYDNDTERLSNIFVADMGSGNVGIGTSSPQTTLDVKGTFAISNSTTSYWDFDRDDSDGSLKIADTGTERMRIDASGNLLVGTTSTSIPNQSSNTGIFLFGGGSINVARSGSECAIFNRITSDGEIVRIQKDGTTVGSIGTTTNSYNYFSGPNTGIFCYNAGVGPTSGGGVLSDNAKDLGAATNRWDDIYATNATIQTSDRNEKQDIEELSDAEQRVAVAAKGLLRKFRWKSSVAEKGDEARTHFGIIAQDLQAAFEAEGLDAGNYAMFIHSTWTDEETGEERSRMGVRYSELLAFIIAAI